MIGVLSSFVPLKSGWRQCGFPADVGPSKGICNCFNHCSRRNIWTSCLIPRFDGVILEVVPVFWTGC